MKDVLKGITWMAAFLTAVGCQQGESLDFGVAEEGGRNTGGDFGIGDSGSDALPLPDLQEGPFYSVGSNLLIASSWITLRRYDHRVEVDATLSGLVRGHVYTFWYVIWNDPSLCETGDNSSTGDNGISNCGDEDLPTSGVEAQHREDSAVVYGIPRPSGGMLAPHSGEITFTTRTYEVGSNDGFYRIIDEALLPVALQNAKRSEIHVVIRDKGPAQANSELLEAQLSSFECQEDDRETMNTNEGRHCRNVAFHIFIPVE